MAFFEEATIVAREYLSRDSDANASQVIQYLSEKGFSKLQIVGAIQKSLGVSIAESKQLVLEHPAYSEDLENLYKALDLAAATNFDSLKAYFDWRPIPNCPGRYLLVENRQNLTPLDLVGSDFEAQEFISLKASDPVTVIDFPGGGLISYRKTDGAYVHTLGDTDGFQRKLIQLGIQIKENT